jgi:hypothetical protein
MHGAPLGAWLGLQAASFVLHLLVGVAWCAYAREACGPLVPAAQRNTSCHLLRVSDTAVWQRGLGVCGVQEQVASWLHPWVLCCLQVVGVDVFMSGKLDACSTSCHVSSCQGNHVSLALQLQLVCFACPWPVSYAWHQRFGMF